MSDQSTQPAGLFLLRLECPAVMQGAPSLDLILTVYTPTETVKGMAVVSEAALVAIEGQPTVSVLCKAYLDGTLTYETILPVTESKVSINVVGIPWIPNPHTNIYPAPTFKAQVVLNHSMEAGIVHYQYQDGDLQWHSVTGEIKQVEQI
jgi:hypothetical protein